MSVSYPRIPYGWADFKAIRLENRLYVDKTRFVRELEQERYAFLIRPRRFGKTCWVSLLENYYDRNRADAFESVFEGTDIGRQPTENRHRYVILRFNFSMFDDALETLQQRFETYCHLVLSHALGRNRDLFSEEATERILSLPSIDAKLSELFLYASDHGIPLYALIDEYDNFANTVLAHHGQAAYQSFTHGSGFFRNFFATLKGGTEQSDGGLERLFITGVSPITMDDVTSGFNIGKNISLDPEFNEMLGFTEEEVRSLLVMYRDYGVFNRDVDTALGLMREWYNGYRFAEEADVDMYNTDMVLYYLDHAIPNRSGPRDLIDTNVRIDYGKLRHLLVTGRRLNGNFDLLRHVIADGEVDTRIQDSFPLKNLAQRENFLSLLYYFGLLSIRGLSEGLPCLGIPNQTVKRLMYSYLREGYEDMGVFSVDFYDFERLTHEMAYRGAWRPVIDYLSDAVDRQTGIRDYIDGEKVVQSFFAAYFGLTDYFVLHSEVELNKGYADLYLEPLLSQHPGMGCGYVIELKYLNRSASLDESVVSAKIHEAVVQLRGYLSDEGLRRRHPSVQYIGLAIVFHGWEMVACEAAFREERNS